MSGGEAVFLNAVIRGGVLVQCFKVSVTLA